MDCSIIALAPNAWHGTWMNRQQLLSRLASRGWPITYSTGPLSVWSRRSEEWLRAPLLGGFERTDGVSVYIAGRLLPRWPTLRSWDMFVLKHHARALSQRANRPDGLILHVFDPHYGAYLDIIRARYIVYHPYDAFSLMPGWTRDAEISEARLVDRADLIIATSPGVIHSLPGSGKKRARLLLNGADLNAADRAFSCSCPEDLAQIPKPRIGYVGSVNPKLDFNVLLKIANHRSDWNIVFVGPNQIEQLLRNGEAGPWAREYAECRKRKNVYFLGQKPQCDAAVYSYHMSTNIIPYNTDKETWASAGSPLKLFENLAVGRPVICSDIKVARDFSNTIDIAHNVDEWIAAIERAVDAGGVGTLETRRHAAEKNSWDSRVDQLDSWLREMTQS